MKKILLLISICITSTIYGQGFGTSASNWPLPVGGGLSGGTNYGFWLSLSQAASGQDVGSMNWQVMDINGDTKPDLVITSQKMSNGFTTVYSPSSSPYWKVYMNSGSGFSISATNWPLPVGGGLAGGTNLGFWQTLSLAASGQDVGSMNWFLMDMNGDSKVDLVVSSEKMSNGFTTVYSPTSNPYWKVYLNTGSGFSTSATNWPLPVGGALSGGTNYGFWLTDSQSASGQDVGSTNWSLTDINGDKKPDLVINSEKMSNGFTTVYSPTSSPYWKTYINTGSSFPASATNWPLPVGGALSGGTNYGFWLTGSQAASGQDVGSTNWTLTDMNGDSKPDLLINSEKMSNGFTTVYSPTSSPYWKVYINTGTSFPASSANWSLPVGGALSGGTNYGFWLTGSQAASGQDVGSTNWSLMDMNGDKKPDIVIHSEKMSNGFTTIYSPSSSPYWKVFTNTGTSFPASSTNWQVPVGGGLSGGTNYGFWLSLSQAASGQDVGSTNWEVMDINGDVKPDLVITSEKMSNGFTTVYSPSSSPYWKVYFNNGLSSVSEQDETANVNIYPNPFHSQITLDSEKGNAVLFNVLGEQVGNWQLAKGKNILEMESLPKGIYLLRINTEKNTFTKKIVKE